MIDLIIGNNTPIVRIARLGANCPNFEERFSYHICSLVNVDALHMFVGMLERMSSIITTTNMNGQFCFTMKLALSAFFVD
jgi:hypothetical protein